MPFFKIIYSKSAFITRYGNGTANKEEEERESEENLTRNKDRIKYKKQNYYKNNKHQNPT